MMKKGFLLLGALMFLLVPAVALADSISPSSFSGSGPTGASYTVNKTVTIDAGTPTTSLVDVFLLSDTTGSMGGTIAAVRTSAAAIVAAAAPLGDVAFGVGEYKDRAPGGGDAFSFRVNTQVTKILGPITAGINSWVASGGGDGPEQAIYALDRIALNLAGDQGPAPGFRPGAAKVVVWFGDVTNKDPGGVGSPGGPVTLAGTIADLQAADVKVAAINVGSMDSAGQATDIKNATGGALFNGIPNAGNIAAIIQGLLEDIFSKYTTVSLDTSEVPAGVGVEVAPGSYVGAFDRSIERTFDFKVTFTDKEPGTHVFSIYATVDGGRVAEEKDSITSRATGVPEPGVMILLGAGLLALAGLRRKIKK